MQCLLVKQSERASETDPASVAASVIVKQHLLLSEAAPVS